MEAFLLEQEKKQSQTRSFEALDLENQTFLEKNFQPPATHHRRACHNPSKRVSLSSKEKVT